MVDCDPNHSEKQGYGADLEVDNFEDDFHAAACQTESDSTEINDCVYTDANQTREHPTSKLISALVNNKLLSSNDGQENHSSEADGLPLHKGDSVEISPSLITKVKAMLFH